MLPAHSAHYLKNQFKVQLSTDNWGLHACDWPEGIGHRIGNASLGSLIPDNKEGGVLYNVLIPEYYID